MPGSEDNLNHCLSQKRGREEEDEGIKAPVDLLRTVSEIGKGLVRSTYFLKAPRLTKVEGLLRWPLVRDSTLQIASVPCRSARSLPSAASSFVSWFWRPNLLHVDYDVACNIYIYSHRLVQMRCNFPVSILIRNILGRDPSEIPFSINGREGAFVSLRISNALIQFYVPHDDFWNFFDYITFNIHPFITHLGEKGCWWLYFFLPTIYYYKLSNHKL